MERDFLGAVGKESPPADDAAAAAAGMQKPAGRWPFNSKTSMPSYVSFKTVPAEEGQFSLSGFCPAPDAAAASNVNRHHSAVLMTPRSLKAESEGVQCYPMQCPPMKNGDRFGTINLQQHSTRMYPAVSHNAVKYATGNASLNAQNHPDYPSSNMVPRQPQPYAGAATNDSNMSSFGHRVAPKPVRKYAQMTIFYGGTVNVFDNVSLDKAQDIMVLATKSSNRQLPMYRSQRAESHPPSAAMKAFNSDPAITKQPPAPQKPDIDLVPLSSVQSSPVSVASQNGALSRSASSSNTETLASKASSPVVLACTQPTPASVPSVLTQPAIAKPPTVPGTTSSSIVPGAVPQARKASLARFLEKRKERVASAAPYAVCNKSFDNGDNSGNAFIKTNPPGTDVNNEKLSRSDQSKSNSYIGESLSTKLQM